MNEEKELRERSAPIELTPDAFRALGHRLVDEIADFLASLADRPVTPTDPPQAVWAAVGERNLPETGQPPGVLLDRAARLLFQHSLLNGHPRFWGYIIGAPAPIGALADCLAAAVNPNCGGWDLAPIASAIEAQTVRWIAQLVGYPEDTGGLLVSGGNMANFIGFLAARRAKAPWDVRQKGMNAPGAPPLRVYASPETHTWIQKAADLFGLGTDAIRQVPTDAAHRMDPAALNRRIQEDRKAGTCPFLVVGTAGTVSTGAVDPLPELAAVCQEHDLWFHVDGAYGAPAACAPEAPADLAGLALADSVAIDPHKWLYVPVEAGCVLVKHPDALRDTFSYRPPYYHLDPDEAVIHYYEHGPQNSRGFRALKVWLALQQAGREGYRRMIQEDMRLARALYRLADAHPELEACTHNLSITTFRFVPADLEVGTPRVEAYLNTLNEAILDRVKRSGAAYISNAVLAKRFVLRACVVNFRTTLGDLEALVALVVRLGRELDAALRPAAL